MELTYRRPRPGIAAEFGRAVERGQAAEERVQRVVVEELVVALHQVQIQRKLPICDGEATDRINFCCIRLKWYVSKWQVIVVKEKK